MTNLIEEHLGYAHAIAAEMLKKLPATIDRSEIESAAELGLVQAANSYDPSRSIPFTTFAYYRIRGAIYDDVRQACRANKLDATGLLVGDEPFEAAAHAAAAATHEAESSHRSNAARYMRSLEGLPNAPANPTATLPLEGLLRAEERERIRGAMHLLPPRNRCVLKAYYFQDLSFEEIARRMGLSKSWVSRIHARSLALMHKLLTGIRETQCQRIIVDARKFARPVGNIN
jgi:RNA polymerase sigma factor FliA